MILKHHSTTDFDFRTANWLLDDSQFISAPTSLKLTKITPSAIQITILKDILSGPIEQGRIVSWCRSPYVSTSSFHAFVFRNLSPDNSASTFPFYAVVFFSTAARWMKYTSATAFTTLHTWLADGRPFIVANEWRCLRVSWWNGKNPSDIDATVCRFERNIDGIWYPTTDAYDTDQLNKNAPVQRCGVGFHSAIADSYDWWDDTEFWKPI